MRRVGILTAGGDCPGLNAVLADLIPRCLAAGYVPVLIRDGFAGLLAEASGTAGTVSLDAIYLPGLARRGGTVLGATRIELYTKEACSAAHRGASNLELDVLVVIGGDGSLVSARLLSPYLPVICIPKTIDNDVACTEVSLGFASAVQTAATAVENLQDTAASHGTSFIVEIMGRCSGFLAAEAGRAAGVVGVIVPEQDWSMQQLLSRPIAGGVVLVAEGAARPKLVRGSHPAGRNLLAVRHSSVAQSIVAAVPRATRDSFRAVSLGHVCRGGSPVAADRLLASRFAQVAFAQVVAKKSAVCAVRGGLVQACPISDIDMGRKFLSPTDLSALGSLLIGC